MEIANLKNLGLSSVLPSHLGESYNKSCKLKTSTSSHLLCNNVTAAYHYSRIMALCSKCRQISTLFSINIEI